MLDIFKKLKEEGDERLSKMVAELAENETFLNFMVKAFQTKAYVDKQTEVLLNTANIASNLQAGELSDRIEQVERLHRKTAKAVEALTHKMDALAGEMAELKAASGSSKKSPGDRKSGASKPSR